VSSPLLKNPTHQHHTTGSDTRATTSRTRWNYNKPTKKFHREENIPSSSQQTTSESVTQGKRKRTKLSDNEEHETASDDDVKKKE